MIIIIFTSRLAYLTCLDWCYCVQLLKILSLALMWQRDFWAGLAFKFPLQEKHARKYQCASFASNSGFTTGNKSYVFSFTKAPYSACFLWKTPPQYPNQKKAHQGIFHFFAHSWGFPPLIHSQGSDCQCRIPQVTSGHNRTFGPTSHFHYAIMPCCARSQHTEEEVFAHRPCYLRDLASQNEIQVVVLLQLSGFCKHANASAVNGTPKE